MTSCSSAPPQTVTVTKIERVPQPIPDALLHCTGEPVRPAGQLPGNVLTDIQTSVLTAEIIMAGRDCRTKLGDVRKLVAPSAQKPAH